MTKYSFYALLITISLAFASCNTEVNNDNILGTWKVKTVEVKSLNPEIGEAHIEKAEARIKEYTYTFLEGENLETFDGMRKIKKGGDFMLDEKRKVLTISEEFNNIKVSPVLWTIEASTPESMTLFLETPGKSTTRVNMVKFR